MLLKGGVGIVQGVVLGGVGKDPAHLGDETHQDRVLYVVGLVLQEMVLGVLQQAEETLLCVDQGRIQQVEGHMLAERQQQAAPLNCQILSHQS